MKKEFIEMLAEGRKKKEEVAPKKEGGKRGRPKGPTFYDDSEKNEGRRHVTFKATVKKEDGKKVQEIRKLGLIDTETVNSLKKVFEKDLYTKYGFDSDVEDIEVFFDTEKASAKASDYRRNDDGVEHSVVGK